MKMRSLLCILVSVCFILTACSGNNNSENMQAEGDISVEESAEEKGIEPEKDIDSSEEAEMEQFEDEMYDPVKFVEPGDMTTQEEECWWQEAELQEDVIYKAEDYGEIQKYGSEFYYEEDVMGFYYNLEAFYLFSFLITLPRTLKLC